MSRLPTLKVLSLKDVIFDNDSLQNLMSGCPIIEYLYFNGPSARGVCIDVTFSATLRNLSLAYVRFTNQWFEGLFSGLLLLESFGLLLRVEKYLHL